MRYSDKANQFLGNRVKEAISQGNRYALSRASSEIQQSMAVLRKNLTNSLFEAIDKDDIGLVSQILTNPADVDFKVARVVEGDTYENAYNNAYVRCTPLYFAKSAKMVQLLVTKGAQPTYYPPALKDFDESELQGVGYTALHHAALHGRTEVVKALLRYGASANARDGIQQTPLYLAVMRKENGVEIIDALVKGGANINAGDYKGVPPLHQAIYANNFPAIRKLLSLKANIEALDYDKQTALEHIVNDEYSISYIKLFLDAGAEINPPHSKGESILHKVASKGRSELVKLILERRPDLVNHANEWDGTPLHYAAFDDNPQTLIEVSKLLVEAGADIETQNKYGRTPLDQYIQTRQYTEVGLKFLLSQGAKVHKCWGEEERIFFNNFYYIDPEKKAKVISNLKVAYVAQQIAENLKANIPIEEIVVIDEQSSLSLFTLFSDPWAVEALKGMIVRYGLTRKQAHEFIKKVKGADTSSNTLIQLEKELCFDTEALLERLDATAAQVDVSTSKQYEDGFVLDRQSHYEALEESYAKAGSQEEQKLRGEELRLAYPHFLDTQAGQEKLACLTTERKAFLLNGRLCINDSMRQNIEYALSLGTLTRDQTIQLKAYLKAKNELMKTIGAKTSQDFREIMASMEDPDKTLESPTKRQVTETTSDDQSSTSIDPEVSIPYWQVLDAKARETEISAENVHQEKPQQNQNENLATPSDLQDGAMIDGIFIWEGM
jgi:ankyrin repeat protein